MESQSYSFLPESLRADARRFDGGASPLEIADFLGSQGLSRGEVMVAFVELFGYSANKAKEVVLGWGSAQQRANEAQSRAEFLSVAGGRKPFGDPWV